MMRKTALITGGSSGIGKACAELYAAQGYNVVITGRNQERIDQVIRNIESHKVKGLGLIAEVNDEAKTIEVINHAISRFGTIDVLICNAGMTMRALFEDLDLEVFKHMIDVNLMGSIYYTKYALPHLLKSKGTIIGISSINGHRGTPARTAYTASKFAMEGFFEALRTEVMYRGVHVLVVSPGYTGTNIRNSALMADGSVQGESPKDEGKMMSAEQVAHHIYRGQIKKKRDIILTPLGWWLIFLNKFVPRLMDRIVYNVLAKEADTPLKKV